MYFEENLPTELSVPYQSELRQKLMSTINAVKQRFQRLNEALSIAQQQYGMNETVFATLAAELFKLAPSIFDVVGTEALAYQVYMLSFNTEHKYIARLEFPNAGVLYDTAFVTTKEWELLRYLGLGGSDAPTIMETSHYKTPELLYFEKLGYPKLKDNYEEVLSCFARGHYLEDKIIESFCKRKGFLHIPETRMFYNKEQPYSTANIDAFMVDQKTNDIIVLE